MTDENEQFRAKLLGYFTGVRRDIASRDLDRYLRGAFTGRWFEHLADTSYPNRITERDLTAIQMLSVTAPPGPTIWILEDGANRIAELLERIPTHVDIWNAADDHFAAAIELWDLLDEAKWPVNTPGRNGLSTARKSKLLAAKRPAMLPVIDSSIKKCLGPVDSFYDAYRFALSQPEDRLLTSVPTVAARDDVTLLRAVDIVVWMADNHAMPDDPDPAPYWP